ncbi:MAG: hypothetical protein PHE27_02025 [Alphaproteobacteria bacterium]|nr:hypothetical protein [Alphaproteobacteria bacterium]
MTPEQKTPRQAIAPEREREIEETIIFSGDWMSGSVSRLNGSGVTIPTRELDAGTDVPADKLKDAVTILKTKFDIASSVMPGHRLLIKSEGPNHRPSTDVEKFSALLCLADPVFWNKNVMSIDTLSQTQQAYVLNRVGTWNLKGEERVDADNNKILFVPEDKMPELHRILPSLAVSGFADPRQRAQLAKGMSYNM